MPRIQAVKNFTVNIGDLSQAAYRPTNIGFHPDEGIVRSITFSGLDAHPVGSFLVYCSLINDYIGSFQVGSYGATVHPNTLLFIPPTQPLPLSLMFRLDTINADGSTSPFSLTGDLSINIDFIKYHS